jgi:shikimate kinase
MKLFLIGFMGSGKSHWGRLLAEKIAHPFFDLDHVITEKEQKSVSQIFSEKGEEYFRVQEKQMLEDLVEEHPKFIISCGGGTPCFFNNITFMKKYGVVVWLNTDVDVLVQRLLKEKHSRPLLKDIPDDDLKSFIMKKLHGRKLYYQQAHVIVNEESLSIDTFMKILSNA